MTCLSLQLTTSKQHICTERGIYLPTLASRRWNIHEGVITGILKQGLDQIDVREHHAAAAISMQSKLIQGFTSTTWGKTQELPTRRPYSRSPCSSNKPPTCFRRPTALVDSKALVPYLSTSKTANWDNHSSKRICNLLKARFMRKSAWFARRVSRGLEGFGEDPILDLQLGPKSSFQDNLIISIHIVISSWKIYCGEVVELNGSDMFRIWVDGCKRITKGYEWIV